jgi:hypothetical protein
MADDFYATAKRMHKSSKTLHNNSEYHNACYLAGYVVECYAKIIVGLSYDFVPSELGKEFSHDLKELNKELQYVITYSTYSAYIVNMRTDFSTILLNVTKWHPIKRYTSNTNTWNQQNSNDFQAEIQLAMQKLAQMKIDGHISI